MRWIGLRGIAVVVLLASLLPRVSVAACPENHIVFTLAAGVALSATSSNSAADTSGSYARGSYDLATGRIGTQVSFYDPGSLPSRWAGSFVDTEDEYWVEGLPSGTPVAFTAELSISGAWNVYPGAPQGEFSSEGFVTVEPDTAQFSLPLPGGCCHGTIARVLTLPLHRFAQNPFRLRLHLGARDYRGDLNQSGQLRFVGLPAGATVVNCHTANQPVTSLRHGTWGRVKAHYR
jgi:hypothetical protein